MMHSIVEIHMLSHVLMVGHSLPYQHTLTKSRGHLAWSRGQQPLFLGLFNFPALSSLCWVGGVLQNFPPKELS